MPWRPAKISDLSVEAAGVINQLFRETNARIDTLNAAQKPYIKGQGTLVFGTIPANSAVERVLHVIGANTNGVAHASPAGGLDPHSNLLWSARVTGPNTVAIRVANPTGSGIAANTIKWNINVVL